MDSQAGIYRITNLTDRKFYIGSAVNLARRKRKHFSELKRNAHINSHLQAAYNKHGAENFLFEIIEIVNDRTSLIKREQHYLDYFRPFEKQIGYNKCAKAGSTLGAIAWNKGIPRTEETKEKIRKANIGKKRSPEATRAGIATRRSLGKNKHTQEFKERLSKERRGSGNPFYGKKHTPENLASMSKKNSGAGNAFFGKSHSAEALAKMSAANKGKDFSPELRKKLSAAGKGRKQSAEHINKRITSRLETLRRGKWI